MASRLFFKDAFQLEPDLVRLYAYCSIGAAGAVTGVVGTGISDIVKDGTGLYSVKLEDSYNRLMYANAKLVSNVDGTAKTCLTGKSAVNTVTFAAKASCTAGDFIVITDTNGAKWGIAMDTTGSSPEPTSALWTAIAAGKKVNVDISGTTTAASVATAVEAAFDALSGVTALITTTVSTADIAFTHVYRAPVAVIAVYKEDGTASPTSFTTANTTTGVQTAVDPTNTTGETLTIASHGFETGRSVALSINSGSLPTGWSATTYYVIVKDSNTIALASSLANAEAGTKVTISDYGDADKTITVTPNAPVGSGVANVEFTSSTLVSDAQTAAASLSMAMYDYTGAVTQPANGSKLMIEVVCRNSNLKAKGES